jgi:hypothetical protein
MGKIAILCLVPLWIVPALHAAVIVQNDFQSLAFEAESGVTIDPAGKPWVITPDALARDGLALLASGKSIPRGTASYTLRFTHPGDYYYYARLRSHTSVSPGSHDQFYLSFDGGNQWSPNPNPLNQDYLWTYNATPYHVGAVDVGRLIPVAIEIFSDEVLVDRIVFDSSAAQLEAFQLDALASSSPSLPEPTAAALAALLAALLIGRRRVGMRS